MTTIERAPSIDKKPSPADLARKAKAKKLLTAEANSLVASAVSTKPSRLAYTSESTVPSAYEDKRDEGFKRLDPEISDEDWAELTDEERARHEYEQEYGDLEEYHGLIPNDEELGIENHVGDDETREEARRSAFRHNAVRNGEVFNASALDRRLSRRALMRTVQMGDFSNDDYGDYIDGERIDTGNVRGTLRPDMGLRTKLKKGEFDDSVTVTMRNPADNE